MRALLDLVDGVLADPADEAPVHPHRRPVALRIERRVGIVSARPMHCLSPVRPPASSPRDRVR